MRSRLLRSAALALSLLLASIGLASAPAEAATTTRTPVMGPSLLTAAQLAGWWIRHHGTIQPRIPALGNNVAALAQIFINEGRADGVRGDMAFVQSVLETGWFGFVGSQIPPDANNFAGIHAFDGRPALATCAHGDSAPSRCFSSPQLGVLTQIELLRSYADPSVANTPGRLIYAPADRRGAAPLWEYFGGTNCPCGKLIWASAPNYGLRIIQLYSQALAESGRGGACVPYAPPTPGPKSGNGNWLVTRDSVVHPLGSARFLGDTRNLHLNKPLTGGESLSTATGYWLLAGDGGIFTYGGARFFGSTGNLRLNAPVNGMERTSNNNGYWLVAYDGGIFSFGNAAFHGSMGGRKLNAVVLGMERTASGNGYWLFAADGGIFSFGDAGFHGSLGAARLTSPVISMQRTVTGRGYWMMTLDGRVFAFGDAHWAGDIAGCAQYGGAARMLVTPDGRGYWIATQSGAVIAFGSARNLGFPATVGGPPVALMSAG